MCDWKKIITTKYTCKHVRWNEPNRSNDEKRNDKALPPHTKNTSALPHELNHQCSDCYHTYEQDACHYWWRVEIALSQEKMSSAFARQMLRGRRLVFVVWRTHGRSLCLFVAKMEPSVALLGARAFQDKGGLSNDSIQKQQLLEGGGPNFLRSKQISSKTLVVVSPAGSLSWDTRRTFSHSINVRIELFSL